ncbi:MAG: Dps family protein [Planctomycetota bacterium]
MPPMTDTLNALLADYQVHYQRMRGYHWNVRGPWFFQLHAKFEELYTGAALKVDELAERVLTLGARPYSTLAEALKAARLEEDEARGDAMAMVKGTVDDLDRLNGWLRAGVKEAEKAGDEATLNLLEGFADEQEKTAWMMRAMLG